MRSRQNPYLKYFITFVLLIVSAKMSAQQLCFSLCDLTPVCWQGAYLNGQIGMGENREHFKFTDPNFFNTSGSVLLGSRFHHKSQGFIGGGALGYNYQIGRFVIGIEAGAVSTNLKKSERSPFFPATDIFSSKVQCIADAKARFGYANGPLLVFITGGWAGGNTRLRLTDTSSHTFAKSKTWANGWTVGTGFDCKFADCLSLGLAYDYTHLKYRNKTASCPLCGTGVGLGSPQVDDSFFVQTLTLRFNYYFSL